jgi:site-specific recombinase XerD
MSYSVNTLQQALPEWLETWESENTRTTYKSGVEAFIRWLRRNNRRGDVQAALDWLDELVREGKKKPTTINTRLTAVRGFIDWMMEGVVSYDSIEQVTGPAVSPEPMSRSLKPKEWFNLLDAQPDTPKGHRDRAMMSLMVYCNIGQSDQQGLDIDDVREEDSRLLLRVEGEWLPLPRPAERTLRDWLEKHPTRQGCLFAGVGNANYGGPPTAQAITMSLREALDLAGLDDVTPYGLRYTAIATAIPPTRKRGDQIQNVFERLPDVAQRVLGHDDLPGKGLDSLVATILYEINDGQFIRIAAWLEIEPETLQALLFGYHLRDKVRALLGSIHITEEAEKILDIVRSHGGEMPTKKIMQNGNILTSDLKPILDELEDIGLLESRPAGRGRRYWAPI